MGTEIALSGANPRISIAASNLLATPAITVQALDAPQLENLKRVTMDQVIQLLGNVGSSITAMAGNTATSTRLPVFNRSVASLVPLADPFLAAVDQIAASPPPTLQGVSAAIQNALGLPIGAVTLALAATDDLRITLPLSATPLSTHLPVSLDLEALSSAAGGVAGVAGLKELAEAGTTSVQVNATAQGARIWLFTGAFSNPTEYLLDSSTLDFGVRGQASGTSFDGSVGRSM